MNLSNNHNNNKFLILLIGIILGYGIKVVSMALYHNKVGYDENKNSEHFKENPKIHN